MKIKELGKIKDLNDLKEIDTNDVVTLLDELRGIAMKRGTKLFGEGKHQARRALGAPEPGAVGGALLFGILFGAAIAAVVTLLSTPWAGPEARRRLTEEVERRARSVRQDGNGLSAYEPEMTPPATAGSAGGSLTTPSA
jgi:hypothetical protein